MYHDLHRQYYWSGMKKHVGDYVRRCLMKHQRSAGLLQPLEVPEWKGTCYDGLCDPFTTDIERA